MNTALLKLSPLLLAGIALTAHATPIIGQINIQAGSVVLTPNQLGAVTSISGSTDGLVTSVTGGTSSYPVTLDGDHVTYSSFSVTLGPQAILPLWSFSGSGYTYSFDLASITAIVQNATSLSINGTGSLISTDPADTGPTAGLWSYDITSPNGQPTSGIFSFQSNNVAVQVPDGGNTLILIGAGLLGIVGLGWRSKKASFRQRIAA
jgi:hypothetical protein